MVMGLGKLNIKGDYMERSETIKELALALSKAQGEIRPAIKDSDNPYFKSKYADLAAVWDVCRMPLSRNGLMVMQHPSAEGSSVSVETLVVHSTGEWISSKLTMIAKDVTPQAIGSIITYLRRYSLSSIIGIASEIDDDGNAASGLVKPQSTQATPPVQATQVKTSPLDACMALGLKKFGDNDKFHAWRIDQGQPEYLNEATPEQLKTLHTKLLSLK